MIKKKKKSNHYPSAILTAEACFNDYQQNLAAYNKIYERVNVALAFNGIVLALILPGMNISIVREMAEYESPQKMFWAHIELFCMLGAIALSLLVSFKLIGLMKGKAMPMFNSTAIREEGIYNETENDAAVWMIEKYTQSVSLMIPIIREKQFLFNRSLSFIPWILVLYVISIIIEKGIL